MIAGLILVVTLPMGMAGRGARPNGDMPSLAGLRRADVQEAMIVLGVGWLLWAVIVIIGRLLQGRRSDGASR
jgi:hypothetical protein